MTEKRTPEIPTDEESPLETVKRLAQEAVIEIETTKNEETENLQARLTKRQTHRAEERGKNYEIKQMEDLAQQLQTRIEAEEDKKAKLVLERNLEKINAIIEKRKNELKNTTEPKTDQTLGEGEERQETVNALHDEALKEEQERNPLGPEDTGVRLAKNAIDNLLAKIAQFFRDDKGEYLEIYNDPPRYEEKKRELTIKLGSLELQIRDIRDALSKKLFFKKKLNGNLAEANGAKNILGGELRALQERRNSAVKNWATLKQQLTLLLKNYAKSIEDRNEALKTLTDSQVEKSEDQRLRRDHHAAKSGIPNDPYYRIRFEYPFLEYSARPDDGRIKTEYPVYIKDANALLDGFPIK